MGEIAISWVKIQVAYNLSPVKCTCTDRSLKFCTLSIYLSIYIQKETSSGLRPLLSIASIHLPYALLRGDRIDLISIEVKDMSCHALSRGWVWLQHACPLDALRSPTGRFICWGNIVLRSKPRKAISRFLERESKHLSEGL